jgi:hypothetical protein
LFTPQPGVSSPSLGIGTNETVYYAGTARGDAVVAWQAEIGNTYPPTEGFYVASRRAGQPFTTPQLLAELPYADVGGPRLTISPRGRFALGWSQHAPSTPAEKSVIVLDGRAGEPPGPPHVLSSGADDNPYVAVTKDGAIVAIWASRPGNSGSIYASSSSDGEYFSPPQLISAPSAVCPWPAWLVPDNAGGVLAGFQCSGGPDGNFEMSRYSPR